MDYKENHRFRLPEKLKYRNYIEAVKEATIVMKENISEYIGCTLTGSLSYGKISADGDRKQSDIDVCLFIDPNKINTEKDTGEMWNLRIADRQGRLVHSYQMKNEYYWRYLANVVSKKLNILSPPTYSKGIFDFTTLALSTKIIDHAIDIHKNGIYYQNNLVRMFHLGVNDKELRVYRKYALDKLALEKNGEELIKKLFDDVVYCETITPKNRDNVPTYDISVHYRV